jgi:hypothetical protein
MGAVVSGSEWLTGAERSGTARQGDLWLGLANGFGVLFSGKAR